MNMAKQEPMQCIGFNLRRADRAVTRLYDGALRELDITTPQFSLMVVIREMQPVQTSQLTDPLIMDRTTLSRNLQRLEDNGLIKTRPNPDDRRTRLVELTDRGQRTLEDALKVWRDVQGLMVDKLGEERFKELLDDLHCVVEAAT